MGKFLVTGVDARTGQTRRILVKAESEQKAWAFALQSGLTPLKVEGVGGQDHARHAGAGAMTDPPAARVSSGHVTGLSGAPPDPPGSVRLEHDSSATARPAGAPLPNPSSVGVMEASPPPPPGPAPATRSSRGPALKPRTFWIAGGALFGLALLAAVVLLLDRLQDREAKSTPGPNPTTESPPAAASPIVDKGDAQSPGPDIAGSAAGHLPPVVRAFPGNISSASTPRPATTASAAPALPKTADAEQVYKLYAPCVVKIIVRDSFFRLLATGSGFFISDSGEVVTNAHVIQDAVYVGLQVPDVGEISAARVLRLDSKVDLAILQTDYRPPRFIKLAAQLPSPGAKVYTISSPLGLTNSITDGLISGLREHGVRSLQFSAAISPGSSGGVVILPNGEAVGVIQEILMEEERLAQNLNLAVPVDEIARLRRSRGETCPTIRTASAQEKQLLPAIASAYELINDKRYDEAIAALMAVQSVGQNDARWCVCLGQGHEGKKDWQAALALYEKADRLQPDNPLILLNYGMCFVTQDRNAEAITPLQRAYALAQGKLKVWVADAYVLALRGNIQFDEAAQVAIQTLEDANADVMWIKSVADAVMFDKKLMLRAIAVLAPLAARYPDDEELVRYYAQATFYGGDARRGAAILEQLRQRIAVSARTDWLLGWCYDVARDDQLAIEAYLRALNVNHEPYLVTAIAEVTSRRLGPAGAERWLRDTMRNGYDTAGIRVTLGKLIYAQGNYYLARSELMRAIAAQPDHAEGLYYLALCCYRTDDVQAAADASRKLAKISPEGAKSLREEIARIKRR